MTPLPGDALLAAAGFGAGALNAVAGGGSFLTLPALLLAGVPPVAANATSTVAVLPGYLGGAWGFRHEVARVPRPLMVQLTAVSLLGGLLGAALLLVTSNAAFTRVVPWMLIFATLLFAIGAGRTPTGRAGNHAAPRRSAAWVLPALGGVAAYGGYFNGGLGILLMAVLTLAKVGALGTVNGLKNYVSALLAAISTAIFACAGLVHWREAALMMVFSSLGGYAGARLAKALSARLVHGFVILTGLCMSALFFGKSA